MAKVDCKVVLLGSVNAGKTCLLSRYLHGSFASTTQSTIGGAFAAKKVQVGKHTVVLGCWDTAGSERYATMTQNYYRKAKAAIVCYDITDRTSLERARRWVSELLRTEENCRLYVCGTKLDIVLDDPSMRDTDRDSAESMAKDLLAGFFETSSKTGASVDELFNTIAKDYVTAEVETGANLNKSDDSVVRMRSWNKNGRCLVEEKSSCCR